MKYLSSALAVLAGVAAVAFLTGSGCDNRSVIGQQTGLGGSPNGGAGGSSAGGALGGHSGAGGAGTGGGGSSGGGGSGGEGGCLFVDYMTPGCGADAVPVCHHGAGGACASSVCGCDGQDRADGCYGSSRPFAHFGMCNPSGGAGGHAGQGAAGGAGTGGGGAGGAGGAPLCGTGRVIYTAPGCGADAVPICTDGAAGACASAVCGCDGQVRADACHASTAPFAYFQNGGFSGACDPNGGGGRAGQGGAGGR